MSDNDERRGHRRFRLWLPARIEANGVVESGLAVGHDMSQHGSLLVTASPLPVGTPVRLHVRIPPSATEEQVLPGEVLRCNPNDADPDGFWPYQIAIRFDQAYPKVEETLRQHSAMLEGLSDTGEQRR